MILTLQIDKEAPGAYCASALMDGVEVTPSAMYSSIEEAIRKEAAAVPTGFAHFIEVQYAGFSSGTLTLEDANRQAADVANKLIELVAVAHGH